jgi:hypothetical protein
MLCFTFLVVHCSKVKSDIGYGVREDGTVKSFLVGDFSSFSPDKTDMFGLFRYGLGRGQLQLGQPTGFLAEANNGIIISDTEGFIGGVELVNGKIEHRDTFNASWRPGFSLAYTKGMFYAGPRVLYTVSNNTTERAGIGMGSVIQLGPAVYWENPGLKIYNLNINNKVSIERRVGAEEIYMFVVRSDI